jgi:Domain of unknown function (DUF4272)
MPVLVNAYCTHRQPPAPQFPHELIERRTRDDPEMPAHLQSFTSYVLSRGNQQMTLVKYRLMRHIQRVRHQFTMNIETDALEAFGRWAQAANAIAYFPDGSIRDCKGLVLLDEDGKTAEGAQVPYLQDSRQRKTRSIKRLGELGIVVPDSLPPIAGEAEVEIRPAAEAALRAMALFLVAVRAEVIVSSRGPTIDELKDRFPLASAGLSPTEAEFLAAAEPEEKQIPLFSWRYESLFALQWALGMAPNLPVATKTCDVPALARRMIRADSERFASDATLRPAGEILDALDLHYRMHWAVRQARQDNKPVPGGMDGGVVYERHYALNWLIRFGDADWDDVDTPT